MEESPNLTTDPIRLALHPKTKRLRFMRRVTSRTVIVSAISLLLIGGVFSWMQIRIHETVTQNGVLTKQSESLTQKIKQQVNINNGVVPGAKPYQDPAGKLVLLDGEVTFDMPKDWSRTSTSTDCASGAIDSTVLCYDVAVIASDKLKDNQDYRQDITASVLQYQESDGSAQNWYETKYYGSPLTNSGTPAATQVDTSNINGYGALSFQLLSSRDGASSLPPDAGGIYVVVHDKYAVMIATTLRDAGNYGSFPGAQPYDNRAAYEPLLKQLVQSIKFKE